LKLLQDLNLNLIDEGYNPMYGARPLRRAVMRLLEDTLSEEFLSEKIKEGDTAVVDVDNDNKVCVLLGDKLELADSTEELAAVLIHKKYKRSFSLYKSRYL